jgi:hypothetical protein
MKRATVFILAGILSAGITSAQSQSGTQGAPSAASNTSAEASRSSGVQAGNNPTAVASAQHNGSQASSSAGDDTSASAGKGGAQVENGLVSSTSAQNSRGSAASATNSTMNATLVRPLDAKKNKPGDPVTARTTQSSQSPDGTTLPKGTQLVGHVTQAQARSKNQAESDLGIVFDKAVLKNGREVPMNATIQAMAAAQNTASLTGDPDDVGLSGGPMAGGGLAATRSGVAGGGGGTGAAHGGIVGGGGALSAVGGAASGVGGGTVGAVAAPVANVGSGVGGTVGSTANVAGGASRGAVGGLNAAGQLASNSQGVFNMQGLNLTSSATNATQGSLITSRSRNVHLDGGTQLLLSAAGGAQTQAPN